MFSPITIENQTKAIEESSSKIFGIGSDATTIPGELEAYEYIPDILNLRYLPTNEIARAIKVGTNLREEEHEKFPESIEKKASKMIKETPKIFINFLNVSSLAIGISLTILILSCFKFISWHPLIGIFWSISSFVLWFTAKLALWEWEKQLK